MKHLFLAALALLTACGTSPQQAKSDVDLTADVVKVEMPIILPLLSPAARDQGIAYAGQIETARQAIDAALASGGKVDAQTLVMALQGLAPIVASNLPPDSPASIAIASAVALAPIILAKYGTVGAARVNAAPADAERNRMIMRGVVR